MKEVNAQVHKFDTDDECTSSYRRVEIDDFLINITRDDSRFFLPPDEDGKQMLAITIEDVLRIWREFKDKDA